MCGIDGAREPRLMRGAARGWRALERWSDAATLCEHYGHLCFKPAKAAADVSLADFLSYAASARADFPHYVVETTFEGPLAALLDDYSSPDGFADALDDIPGTKSRPHLFIGGARTGSLLHVDTRCTCGWNVCLFGAKRWCLLGPETRLSELGIDACSDAPGCWFADHLPALRVAALSGRVRMRECIQRPGELVYIPFGWHHAIVNLEVSCAIAHTLITPASLPAAWAGLCTTYPSFAIALREQLQSRRPELAESLPPTEATGQIGSAAEDRATPDVLASSVVSLCGSEYMQPAPKRESPGAGGDGSAADSRWPPIAAAFSSIPSSCACLVEARLDPTKGAGLYASRACRGGDVLLEVPLSVCVTSSDLPNLPAEIAARLPPTDSFGRLLVAVTRLLSDSSDPPHHPLSEYFRELFGPAALATMMGSWSSEDAPAAERAANSVAWQRAQRQRAEAITEANALERAGVLGASDRETYLRAKLLLQTRAFKLSGGGHALVPVLDLVNHMSLGATARQRCVQGPDGAATAMQLVANYALDVGDEISICYDPEADYLDAFERYGFFDSTSVVHTAEVVVPNEALWAAATMGGDAARKDEGGRRREAWRSKLVAAEMGRGSDAAFKAWWVPDFHASSCPLFAAVRATVVSKEELEAGPDPSTVLQKPISRESVVRAALANILSTHLRGYECTPEQAESELRSGLLGVAEEAATRLILFEQVLLIQQLRALERAGPPPTSCVIPSTNR
jgi:hypothetical protein